MVAKSKPPKSVKIFSLEIFRLYSTTHVKIASYVAKLLYQRDNYIHSRLSHVAIKILPT